MKHLLLIAVVACNHGPQLPPEELPAAVCTEANNGQTVAVSGFLVMPELLFGCRDDCALTIAASKGSHDGMRAVFSVGPGHDQIAAVTADGNLATTGAKPTDTSAIRILPDEGTQVLAIGDPVRVSGQLTMSHELGRTTCIMAVDTIEAFTKAARVTAPRVDRMVFVDFDPVFAPANAAILRRIARRELRAAGIASRFVDRETGNFFFEGSLLRGDLEAAQPAWWPEALRGAWTSGVADCRTSASPPSCAHHLHATLWEQWLTSQHAARYVSITQSGGESFVPGEPNKRVIDVPASTTETREDQLGKLVPRLAHGEGRELARSPKDSTDNPTDNPLYIAP